jgi:hypothetical protein
VAVEVDQIVAGQEVQAGIEIVSIAKPAEEIHLLKLR